MLEVEVWVKVDEDGNACASTDKDDCAQLFTDNIGDGTQCTRMVRVVLHIPAPKPIEIDCTVPDMANEGTATVRG